MDQRPNIIVIMTDQHRGDCLGVDNAHPVLTPNLDGLAADGVRFSRAYSTCPVCIPARRSFMSGQFPATHGLRSNRDGLVWQIEDTAPSMLRNAGYQTFLVGRDMHQFPSRRRFGFDEMITHHDYFQWLARSLAVEVEHGPTASSGGIFSAGVMHNDWTARPWPYEEDLHPTNWVVTEARRFLRRRDPTCPFFLVVSFIAPHPPLIPPQFHFERYLRLDSPDARIGSWAEPPHGTPLPAGRAVRLEGMKVNATGEIRRSYLAGYYGAINHVDDQINRLLSGTHGIETFDLDNTVIVFTSDHGEMLGDHYLWAKAQPYEGAARIPLIVSAPPRFGLAVGHVVDQPVCLEDIMPTLLDVAGIPISPGQIDGVSLLPLLRGVEVPWRESLYIEHSMQNCRPSSAEHSAKLCERTDFCAITDGREKYVWFIQDGHEQLFDIIADPYEINDLATDPDSRHRVYFWRQKLITHIEQKGEGLVRDGDLPGRRQSRDMTM